MFFYFLELERRVGESSMFTNSLLLLLITYRVTGYSANLADTHLSGDFGFLPPLQLLVGFLLVKD